MRAENNATASELLEAEKELTWYNNFTHNKGEQQKKEPTNMADSVFTPILYL